MHWWQIAIRLVLIANCLGNLRGAIRAGRERDRDCLHWLVPKTTGWTMLFLALLPTRYGGVGIQYWDAVAGIGLVLLLYGILIERTASSQPRIEWNPVGLLELPHLGRIDGASVPLLMVVSSVFAFLLFVVDVIYRHRVTTGITIILVSLPLMLSFGIRLLLRQYNMNRLSDLIELAKSDLVELVKAPPRLLPAPAQHDWIKPDKDESVP